MSCLQIIGTLFILCAVGSSLPQTEPDLDTASQNEQEVLAELQKLLQSVHALLDPSVNRSDANFMCGCHGLRCRCCHRIHIGYYLNKDCCISVHYERYSRAFAISASFGHSQFFRHDFPLISHRPFCLKFGSLFRHASFCIQLRIADVSGGRVHSCITISAKRFYTTMASFEECFDVYFNAENEPIKMEALSLQDSSNRIEIQQAVPFQPLPAGDELIMMERIKQLLQDPNPDLD